MSTEAGANKNWAIFFLLLFCFRLLKPSLPFHLFISSTTHRVRGGQEEVQGENLEPGTLPGGRAVAPQSLGSQKPSLQCATSSSAFSQRELPLCKLAGRAGGVGERVGQEACLVSSWREDPGGGKGRGEEDKGSCSPTGHFPCFLRVSRSF